MAHTYARLRGMLDDELVAEHDRHAQTTTIGLSSLRDELARREHARDTKLMINLTKQMRNMTVAVLVLTGVVTVATIMNLYVFYQSL
ncbi:hypothetical protein NKH73_31560 [Mesorhizobium sp. M0938]|uniref:hypothetical protein n=1 Tax=unclassified Mesorhizobium TaxID=325217 RepID=UPI003336575B